MSGSSAASADPNHANPVGSFLDEDTTVEDWKAINAQLFAARSFALQALNALQVEEMIIRAGGAPSTDTASLNRALETHASVCRLDAFPSTQESSTIELPGGLAMPHQLDYTTSPQRSAAAATATAVGNAQPSASVDQLPRMSAAEGLGPSDMHTAVSSANRNAMAALAATLAQDIDADSDDSEESEEFI